ncbi:MAG: ATP-binding protein, partial [Pseudomonadota bacterium]
AAIGEVASVIIHEIKNPLGIIKISGNTLKKRYPEDARTVEILGFIEEEVNRMNDTVTNFLDYAKPKHPIKRRYSVEELKAYLFNMRPEIEKEGHKLEINISEGINNFEIDPDHLKQMLLNLLINAKEASTHGSVIKVDVTFSEGDLEISVTDSGKGISEEVSKRLFDPFYTTKEHGTGLGLSVTKQLARINNGDVKWENKPEGGTVFTISLHNGDTI